MSASLAASVLASSKSSNNTRHSGGAWDLPRIRTNVGEPSSRVYLQRKHRQARNNAGIPTMVKDPYAKTSERGRSRGRSKYRSGCSVAGEAGWQEQLHAVAITGRKYGRARRGGAGRGALSTASRSHVVMYCKRTLSQLGSREDSCVGTALPRCADHQKCSCWT